MALALDLVSNLYHALLLSMSRFHFLHIIFPWLSILGPADYKFVLWNRFSLSHLYSWLPLCPTLTLCLIIVPPHSLL